MARARNIKPGLFTNDLLAEVDPLGRLLFIGLWTIADRAGRLEDRPKRIRAEVLPYDDCDVDALLRQLHERGFISRYVAENIKCIQIVNFCKHQNPHVKERASEIPERGEHDESPVQAPDSHSTNPADSLLLIPDSGIGDPDPLQQQQTPAPRAAGRPARTNGSREPKSAAAWEAYCAAHYDRYGVDPVRNAKVNGMLCRLVDRLGAADAAAVAGWYVEHPDALYVRSGHTIDLLLRDAEKLRTEWATNRRTTAAGARELDGRAERGQAAQRVIDRLRAEEGQA